MRVAFFADVHANLPALEAALADARERGATHLIHLGDAVGYGPQPAETLARLRQVAAAAVLGNHDAAACGLLDPALFNPFARETAERAALALDQDAKAWLRDLPYVLEGDGFACAHGGFDDPEAFHYLETKEDALPSLAAMPGFPLLAVGHTHIPCVFAQDEDGALRRLPPEDFALRPGCRYVVNPGSVGFPRGDRLTADYLLYDTVTRRIAFRAVPYDLAPYRLALVRNGYNPMNYWFLSPSARRRQTEQAFLRPTRASSAPSPSGPFRPRRAGAKSLPKGFWALLLALVGLLAVAFVGLRVLTPPPAPPPAAQAGGNLLPHLSLWNAEAAPGLLCQADPPPRAPQRCSSPPPKAPPAPPCSRPSSPCPRASRPCAWPSGPPAAPKRASATPPASSSSAPTAPRSWTTATTTRPPASRPTPPASPPAPPPSASASPSTSRPPSPSSSRPSPPSADPRPPRLARGGRFRYPMAP